MYKPFLAAALLCAVSIAQQKPSPEKAKPAPAPPLPGYNIVFSPNTDFSIPSRENFPALPHQCDGSGNLYFTVFADKGMELASFASNGIVTFGTNKINDISSPALVRAFVASSGVYALVEGMENAEEEEHVVTLEDGKELRYRRTEGDTRYYIARFDSDGSYKGSLKLDSDFLPIQAAAFEGGNFLVGGLDAGKTPRIALLDSYGQVLKFLQLPKDKAEMPKPDKKSSDIEPGSSEALAMLAQFVPYRADILFKRNLTDSLIYEISESGEARAVKIKVPEGLREVGLLSSDQNWLVLFGRGFGVDETTEIYEVNPENGKLLARYRGEGAFSSKTLPACRFGGKFLGLSNKDGKITMLSGAATSAARK